MPVPHLIVTPMYRIIGADRKEYGPAGVEQIRRWIAEGRVDRQTQVREEGSGQWRPLAEFPQLIESLKGNVTVPPIRALPQTAPQAVVINGVTLNTNELEAIAVRWQMRVPAGRYWYDRISGAWGIEGGPTAGFTVAGLDLGGALRADASGGGHGLFTGVFINGRELHPMDVAALSQFLQVMPGRFWVDASGNFGFEGQPYPLGNLVQVARARGAGGNAYLRRTSGGYIGGDDNASYFFDPSTGASVIPGEGLSS